MPFGTNRNACGDSQRPIRALLRGALTDKIDDREMFIKGIDYSYYYESDEPALVPEDAKP